MKNPWSGLRNVPRQVWILSLAVLVNRAGTMVLPFMVLYFTTRLHFSVGLAGSFVALYGVGALITAPLAGRLSDRYGSLRVIRFSLFTSSLVMFVFPLAKTVLQVFIATLLLALTVEMFRPASLAVISSASAPEQRKAAFALNRLAVNLGMSIGPVVAGFLARSSFFYLFFIDAITSTIAGVILVVFPFHLAPQASTIKNGKEVSRGSKRPFSDSRFLYFAISCILVTIVFFQHMSSMPVFMVRDLKLSPAIYGSLFSLNTLLIVLLEVPLNLKTTHWSARGSLAFGALLLAGGFGLMAFPGGLWIIILSLIVWTFGEMILFPGMSAYVSQIASSNRHGEYMGWYTMAFSLGFIIGPWLGTLMLDRYGHVILWSSMFLIGAVAAWIFVRLDEKPAYV